MPIARDVVLVHPLENHVIAPEVRDVVEDRLGFLAGQRALLLQAMREDEAPVTFQVDVGDLNVGFCLDTCHAHAGGEDLLNIVDRVKAITGRIDLVHANGSKDGFDSGRDRHDNLFGGGSPGTLDAELVAAVVRAAGAPVVVETPGGADGQGADIAYLRAHL